MLPDGLHYVDSWIVDDERLDRCYQLMETDDPSLFDEWLSHWSDLGEFEVIPVIDSAAAAARCASRGRALVIARHAASATAPRVVSSSTIPCAASRTAGPMRGSAAR